MICLEYERTIESPIEEVFARLADIDRYEEWLPHSGIYRGGRLAETDTAPEEGAEFFDHTPLGRLRGEITELDPPRRLAFRQRLRWKGKLVFESRPRYTLVPKNGGTRVVHEAEGELHGAFRLARPLVWLIATKERQRILDELKRSLEA